jgi:hypothetical protein
LEKGRRFGGVKEIYIIKNQASMRGFFNGKTI